MKEIRPNAREILFLNLAYNRFYDLSEEIFENSFWSKDQFYRLSKIRDAFCVYAELLNYEPLKWELENIEKGRPPIESEIAKDLFKFIRNVLSHFPFFQSWEEIWISSELINWNKPEQTIDRFLKKNLQSGVVKYRFWEERAKTMTYVSINFPRQYDETKLFLSDIISEKDGVKFSLVLMNRVLGSQIEEIGRNG